MPFIKLQSCEEVEACTMKSEDEDVTRPFEPNMFSPLALGLLWIRAVIWIEVPLLTHPWPIKEDCLLLPAPLPHISFVKVLVIGTGNGLVGKATIGSDKACCCCCWDCWWWWWWRCWCCCWLPTIMGAPHVVCCCCCIEQPWGWSFRPPPRKLKAAAAEEGCFRKALNDDVMLVIPADEWWWFVHEVDCPDVDDEDEEAEILAAAVDCGFVVVAGEVIICLVFCSRLANSLLVSGWGKLLNAKLGSEVTCGWQYVTEIVGFMPFLAAIWVWSAIIPDPGGSQAFLLRLPWASLLGWTTFVSFPPALATAPVPCWVLAALPVVVIMAFKGLVLAMPTNLLPSASFL